MMVGWSKSKCLVYCTPQQQQRSSAASNTALDAGLIVGGVVGALVGSSIRRAHWQEVSADRIGVRVRPAGGGLGLGLTLRF